MRKIKNIFRLKRNRKGFRWNNLSIGKKYISVYLITGLLFLLAGIIVYFQLNNGKENILVIEEQSERVNMMSQMAFLIQVKDAQIADYIMMDDEELVTTFKNYQREWKEIETTLVPKIYTEEEHSIFKEIKDKNDTLDKIFLEEIIPAVENGNIDTAQTYRLNASNLRESIVNSVEELMDTIRQEQINSIHKANKSMHQSILVLALTILVTLIIGITLMYLVSRAITQHLKNVVNITTEMSKGNLAVESIDYVGTDEVGSLTRAMNQMKQNIRNIVENVSKASGDISSQSEELTQSSQEVNEGGQQIASTMEEIASGSEMQAHSAVTLSENMNEFVKRIHASERDGQVITESSNKVLELTTNGESLMKSSVKQMQRIDDIVTESVDRVKSLESQSDSISELVFVIKDIADQTNLLSLNAAIEAARAGEHGKGFAVVADEVRNLAEQVATSVTEITEIVNNIQIETDYVVTSLNTGYEEVKDGTAQIEKTERNFSTINKAIINMGSKIKIISNNLKEISENSNDMNQLIEEVASVSEESAAGVEQTTASVQQSSSSMEKVSNSAVQLSKLAETMKERMRQFKL